MTTIKRILSTEDEFTEYCPCAYKVLNFVSQLETDALWFFDVCYNNYEVNTYSVIFKSYVTDEYKDYIVSIQATKADKAWDIELFRKVDGLGTYKRNP